MKVLIILAPRIAQLFLSILILISACKDNAVTPIPLPDPNDTDTYDKLTISDKIQLITSPTFASRITDFKIYISLVDKTLKVKSIKYDFNNDKKYDITKTLSDTVKNKFQFLGYNKIIATIILEDNITLSCSTNIWISDPELILSDGFFFFEPSVYNGNFLSVTHGPRHQIQFIDLNTHVVNQFFSGFSSTKFDEMHCSIPDFDGRKILFDNGTHYMFCNFNFADSSIVDVPIYIPNYPIGQITWSLDNQFIYFVSRNYDGIKSYNLNTKEIKSIFNKGNYICVIPDRSNKLAILEKLSVTESKLIIFNLESGSIEKEYPNIPFNSPFRMLRNGDRIYLDGQLAFYSLTKQKVYKLDYGEFDLSQHMYGEADITMDGDKFIIGLFTGDRGLYKISLPATFEED